ncbi:MAG: PIN domain-containing protein [Chthoniobacterales bacterium]|nr:PIN domain-containing protein [Chthoniobacterales bacterium]
MTLIDTSSWVEQLRIGGNAAVRARVESLLQTGRAAWCAAVRLELWAGVSNDRERAILQSYARELPDLVINSRIWQEACDLASRCRKAGKRAPTSDILIAACARHHEVGIETADAHFDFLMTL